MGPRSFETHTHTLGLMLTQHYSLLEPTLFSVPPDLSRVRDRVRDSDFMRDTYGTRRQWRARAETGAGIAVITEVLPQNCLIRGFHYKLQNNFNSSHLSFVRL